MYLCIFCRDCFVDTNKLYPETASTTKQMYTCGQAEYEELQRTLVDPTYNYDQLAFYKCMLMLRSDKVYDRVDRVPVDGVIFKDEGRST